MVKLYLYVLYIVYHIPHFILFIMWFKIHGIRYNIIFYHIVMVKLYYLNILFWGTNIPEIIHLLSISKYINSIKNKIDFYPKLLWHFLSYKENYNSDSKFYD